VAETYRTLEALYPGRIDLGIGRAGGADERALRALRSAGGEHFSRLMSELIQFDGAGYPPEHPFGGVQVVPGDTRLPPVWILGSSGASAESAGAAGFGYAFASHFSPAPADLALGAYRSGFKPSAMFPAPHAILCVAAIAAETAEEAERLWSSTALTWLYLHRGEPRKIPSPEQAASYDYTPLDRRVIEERRALSIVGTPDAVKAEIGKRAAAAGADEVMIATITHDPAARLRSYELIAEAFA
jgi:luciferase family oxidoreductase group 1